MAEDDVESAGGRNDEWSEGYNPAAPPANTDRSDGERGYQPADPPHPPMPHPRPGYDPPPPPPPPQKTPAPDEPPHPPE